MQSQPDPSVKQMDIDSPRPGIVPAPYTLAGRTLTTPYSEAPSIPSLATQPITTSLSASRLLDTPHASITSEQFLEETSGLNSTHRLETSAPQFNGTALGKASVFRVDQTASAWQTAQDALEAGMGGLSSISNPQRTGGRRGRGPRRQLSPVPTGSITLLTPHDHASGNETAPTTPKRGSSTPRRGRGGISRNNRARKTHAGSKRKRSSDSDDENGDGTSSSEEITALPSQSRSGRKITQANQPSITKLELDEEEIQDTPLAVSKQSHGLTHSMPAPSPVTAKPTPSKSTTRKVKRTPGQSAACKNCSRGPSPASNAIVFCDGCNTPWHQHCHHPPIKQEYLLEVDRDWFCADCVLLREHSVMLEGKVAGHGMSMLEKRKYFKSLPPSTLIALLLHASSLYPNLPIFPPKAPVVNIDIATLEASDQGLYEEVIDELPYPQAGHGIQLRPESEDIDILVDDNTAVYSHHSKGIAELMAEAGWSRKENGVRTTNGVGVRAGA